MTGTYGYWVIWIQESDGNKEICVNVFVGKNELITFLNQPEFLAPYDPMNLYNCWVHKIIMGSEIRLIKEEVEVIKKYDVEE